MATNPMSVRFLEITEGDDKGKIMAEVTLGNCIVRRWPTEDEMKTLKVSGVSVMKTVTSKVTEDEEGGLVMDKADSPEDEKKTTGARKKTVKAPAV